MKRWVILLMLLVLAISMLPAAASGASGERTHVVLIDGSGSMEDPAEKMLLYSTGKVQSLVNELTAVEAAFGPGDQLAIGIFSKTAGNIKSPQWVYRGTVGNFRSGAPKLAPIGGWTDLVGTMDAGIAEVKAHPGTQFLWLLTDNIDQATDETKSTEQFYQYLAGKTELERIYVFPVDVGEARGLVLYGMIRQRSQAERTADNAALDEAVKAINASSLKPRLGDGGFLVRPLSDQGLKVEIVSFTPDKRISPDVKVKIDPTTGQVTVAGYEEGKPIRGQFKVVLTSLLPALKITDATVTAELSNVTTKDFVLPKVVSQNITPTKVTLAPGEKAEYTVDLNIEPPFLLFNALKNPLAALEDWGTLSADLRLVVKDVTFAATQPDKFYKVQQIPEILGNQSKVTMPVTATMTAQVRLDSARPMALAAFVVAVLVLLFLIYKATLGRRYVVHVWYPDFDKTEAVTLRHSMVVPHFGKIVAGVISGLTFVPEMKGPVKETKRPLKGGRNTITLKDGRTFQYEVGSKSRKQKPQGGYPYARTATRR